MPNLLVVGGGPAGLAGAARAAEVGLRVELVDDNPGLGGQIWRGQPTAEAAAWVQRVQGAGVGIHCGLRVVDAPRAQVLRAETVAGEMVELRYDRLLLATGARERFLPFPGWTLPHVLGAGGLQALVKGGLPIAGKRVVVAGTGPLLLAVAAYLRDHGAEIATLCDQAGWLQLLQFATALTPAKMLQGLQLAGKLGGVRPRVASWPLEARPGGVVLRNARRQQFVACDYLACGYHLVPNNELARALGCALQLGFVLVDERQQTSVQGVYCAGEPTGIGGVELALTEGEIAGLAAAGRREAGLEARREKQRAFAGRMEAAFRLRPELLALPRADTLVCRCEDVTWGRIQEHGNWRAAKLQTRCGMGPCQGRVCGAALEFLLGWTPESVRPPIYPASVAALADAGDAAGPPAGNP